VCGVVFVVCVWFCLWYISGFVFGVYPFLHFSIFSAPSDSAKLKSQAYKHSMIDKDGNQIRKNLLLEPPTLDDRMKEFERIMSDPFQKKAQANRSPKSKVCALCVRVRV